MKYIGVYKKESYRLGMGQELVVIPARYHCPTVTVEEQMECLRFDPCRENFLCRHGDCGYSDTCDIKPREEGTAMKCPNCGSAMYAEHVSHRLYRWACKECGHSFMRKE